MLQTVEFYMYKCRPIKEYVHAADGTIELYVGNLVII